MADRKIFNNFIKSFFGGEPKIQEKPDKPFEPVVRKRVKKKVENRRGMKASVRDVIVHGKPKYYKHL